MDNVAVAETVSDFFVRRLKAKEWFLERQSGPDSHRRRWVAHLLVAIPRVEVDKAIEAEQTRRADAANQERLYPDGAVVCVEDAPSPFSAILKTGIEQHLSKFHISVFDQASSALPDIPILRLSIDVDREHTIYDRQFVLARIVCRIQRRMADGTTVTEHSVGGSNRAYARTIEIATETAVDEFLGDEGRKLIRAIRGW